MIRTITRMTAALLAGCFVAWLTINLTEGGAVVVINQAEAEGPEFNDPGSLDIVTHIRRLRVCPAVTQRWVWRWTTYRGERAQQTVPLQATSMPFLADSPVLIMTLPNPGGIDLRDEWYFRSVTAEQCSWLPTWASGFFGTHVFRSADLPVNFVGAPHTP